MDLRSKGAEEKTALTRREEEIAFGEKSPSFEESPSPDKSKLINLNAMDDKKAIRIDMEADSSRFDEILMPSWRLN